MVKRRLHVGGGGDDGGSCRSGSNFGTEEEKWEREEEKTS